MSSERKSTDWMKPFDFRDSEIFISMARCLEHQLRDNSVVWSDDAYARVVMGLFYYEKANFGRSGRYFRKSLILDPFLWRAFLTFSMHIATIEEAALGEEHPWNVPGLLNYPSSIVSNFFQLPVHSDNDRVNALISLGIFYRNQAEVIDVNRDGLEKSVQYYHLAGQCFEEVTKTEPSLWQVHIMLFMCHIRLGLDCSETDLDKKKYFFGFVNDYKIFDNDETRKKISVLIQKLMQHSPEFREEVARIANIPDESDKNLKKQSSQKQKHKKALQDKQKEGNKKMEQIQ